MNRSAPDRPDELQRLALLRSYEILDTSPDPSFDRIARLAADLLSAPVSAISLVDEERQWFKARCGLSASETPREIALCAHTILSDEPLVVPDATADPRFRQNPLVTGEPHIRTYVGIPLLAVGGLPLGTLCVIYQDVRDVSAEQVSLLRQLAGLAADMLEMHRLKVVLQKEACASERLRADMQVNIDIMRSMSDITKTGGWLVDAATKKVTWTDETFRIHGLEPGDAPPLDGAIGAYTEECRPVISRCVQRGLESGESWDVELCLDAADGTKKWVRTLGKPGFGEDGSITKLYGAIQDITAEYRRREELESQRKEAEAANRAKDEFLAAISHEIRTPMNGVLGMLGLIRKDHLEPAQQERIEIAHQSAEALLALLNDVIEYAKIQSGPMAMASEPIDVRKLVRGACGLFFPTARKKGIVLEVFLAGRLPEFALGDAGRLRQVMTNLVSNAIKYTDEGGVFVEVDVSTKEGSEYLAFSVKDTGIGVPQSKRGSLFQRFAQIDTGLSRRYGGAGLGLAISKEIVTAMGGEIGMEPTDEGGSHFWFTVPLVEAGAEDAAEPGAVLPDKARCPKRILLVEDNEVNRMVVEAICVSAGHEVTIAEDGEAALRLFDPARFDVVLMDMQMPKMDGLETTRQLRARWPSSGTRIIALTANALEAHRTLCLEAGMDEFQTKPIRADDLLKIL